MQLHVANLLWLILRITRWWACPIQECLPIGWLKPFHSGQHPNRVCNTSDIGPLSFVVQTAVRVQWTPPECSKLSADIATFPGHALLQTLQPIMAAPISIDNWLARKRNEGAIPRQIGGRTTMGSFPRGFLFRKNLLKVQQQNQEGPKEFPTQ